MGKYARAEKVRIRLIGKVRFTEDEKNENAMHVSLRDELIEQAEGEIEVHLSPRYEVPIQGTDGKAFERLPESPGKFMVQTLCEAQACIRILETDYGAGSAVDASKYKEQLEKRVKEILEMLMGKRKVNGAETNQWVYPPLKEFKLAPFNSASDDGYMGRIWVTGQGDGGFPAKQINDPSETFFNGELDV